MDRRVDPAARRNEPLHYALGHGHANVVRLLLEDDRVRSTVNIRFAADYAKSRGQREVLVAFLEALLLSTRRAQYLTTLSTQDVTTLSSPMSLAFVRYALRQSSTVEAMCQAETVADLQPELLAQWHCWLRVWSRFQRSFFQRIYRPPFGRGYLRLKEKYREGFDIGDAKVEGEP